MVWHRARLLFRLSCLMLLVYNGKQCIEDYLRYETVTTLSSERQETQPLPRLCLSSESYVEKQLRKLGLTLRKYKMVDNAPEGSQAHTQYLEER